MKPAYYRQASKIPLLTAAQEIELARAIKAGLHPGATEKEAKAGRKAREKFARSNLRLVFKAASFYERRGGKLDFDDLVQLGNLGLMRAIDKFDHERGYKFSTYAYAWIRQSIQRGIMDQGRTIRLPTHVHEDFSKIKKLISEHKRSGSTEYLAGADIAAQLSIPMGRYQEMNRMWFDACSTDAPVALSDSADGRPMIEGIMSMIMECDREPVDDHQRDMLRKAINRLPPKEREIVIARHGLDGREPESLATIGQRLGLSRERVRQINEALTNKLRALLT